MNVTNGSWTSTTLDEIKVYISEGVQAMSADMRQFWELVKISPQKWQEKEYGELGGGFWVVGLIGQTVIWYNDIEEGFNLSAYSNYGEIDQYNCEQDQLCQTIQKLFLTQLA